MYKAKYLSPMIPSYNIEKTAPFFKNALGFKIRRDDKTYIILHKDNLTVHVLRGGSDIGKMEVYLEVDNLEKVWNNMENKLEGIKVREPFDREYGMREIHVVIPETKALMFIGQEIK